ncbi:DUF445 domain-containing protein [Ruegeria halocynthiae]|uniref:DUF445 domain-containing protein n=1 Tax=Ruegeria halocynthiae TaxID=985054 RepID=UPI000565DE81|nr:DUF445 domain-containing protein [Ruegeria halocynthiae]
MSATSTGLDADKAAGTRRVRRVATGILIFLTLVYAASFTVTDPPVWLRLIRAMAEAGMVGGLADWFAVEALFRHPLRIPIPHTALLPKNQKRAAGNIARFIDEYFLVPDQVLARIQQFNPVHRLAGWLTRPENAQMVARELSQLLQLVVKSQSRGAAFSKATKIVRGLLLTSVTPADLAQNLSRLLKDSARGRILDEILLEVRNVVDQNRDKVTELVQEHSRWWIASSVDKGIVRLLVDGILSLLDELSDEKSELRQEFNSSIEQFVDSFQNAGRIEGYIAEGVQQYADSPEFAATVQSVGEAILSRIERGFEEHPEQAGEFLADAVREFAQMLLEQPELEQKLNARLESGLATVLQEARPAIVRYATQVISDWDSADLVNRIELEVGQDLQFIRINGAVLGALVGGFLYLITLGVH